MITVFLVLIKIEPVLFTWISAGLGFAFCLFKLVGILRGDLGFVMDTFWLLLSTSHRNFPKQSILVKQDCLVVNLLLESILRIHRTFLPENGSRAHILIWCETNLTIRLINYVM